MTIEKMNFSDYVKREELNMSSLCNIKKSPAHFLWAKQNPKDSASLVKGRLIHTMILEPTEIESTYAVEPSKEDFKYVTVDDLKALLEKYSVKKASKKEETIKALAPFLSNEEKGQVYDLAYADFLLTCGAKEVVSAKEYSEARATADSVLKSPKIQSMLKKGQSELSIFQIINDVKMKFRLDFLAGEFFLDVKSCRSCEERNFLHDFVDYQYAEKLAAYQKAVELETGKKIPCIVLAVETDSEHDYKVYEISQEFLDAGYRNFEKMLSTWKDCTEKNEWPGLNKNIETLHGPIWYVQKSLE